MRRWEGRRTRAADFPVQPPSRGRRTLSTHGESIGERKENLCGISKPHWAKQEIVKGMDIKLGNKYDYPRNLSNASFRSNPHR